MSKKKYMKPGIEMVVFNNNDDNMSDRPTYLTASNHNFRSLKYKGNIDNSNLHY